MKKTRPGGIWPFMLPLEDLCLTPITTKLIFDFLTFRVSIFDFSMIGHVARLSTRRKRGCAGGLRPFALPIKDLGITLLRPNSF